MTERLKTNGWMEHSSRDGEAARGRPGSNVRRPKVMVVDDDEVVLQALAAFLEGNGYQVIPRPEALGTMLAISREKPDILVMDIEMPGLSGDALFTLLSRRFDPAPCVIFHSSRPAAELERLTRTTGARGAIAKNDPRDFVGRLEALLPPALRAAR